MYALNRNLVYVAVLAGVSACSSSTAVDPLGPVIPVVPVIPVLPVDPPPAGPGPTPAAVTAFEALAANPNSASISSATSLPPHTVSLSEGAAGDGAIDVTVDSTVYSLAGSVAGGNPVFTDSSAALNVSVSQVAEEGNVVLSLIRTGNGTDTDPTGYSALGAVTSAADLSNLIGVAGASAIYTGTSSLVAIHENSLRDTAEGDLYMSVDFETSTFVGSMDLVSTTTGGQNFEITDVNAMFSNGLIADGLLTADIEVGSADPATHTLGGNPSQLLMDPTTIGKLSGSFYGANAGNVGGTFNFSGTEPNQFGLNPPQKIQVQGGFIGTQ